MGGGGVGKLHVGNVGQNLFVFEIVIIIIFFWGGGWGWGGGFRVSVNFKPCLCLKFDQGSIYFFFSFWGGGEGWGGEGWGGG